MVKNMQVLSVFLPLLALLWGGSERLEPPPSALPPAGLNPSSFSYRDYARVLSAFVDAEGNVDYAGLKSNRGPLDRFARQMADLSRADFDTWTEVERLAFWINAYNALTLQVILDHYPIQSSFLTSLVYPKNSIRQISGVWDKIRFEVMGQGLTLDQIEHEILRKEFNEPRIHMALVCAARGCPPLRQEPYEGARLDSQLDDQARRFLNHPGKFRIDRGQGKVYLSKIFDWFGGDFISRYSQEPALSRFDPSQRAVLSFVSRYLQEEDRSYLLRGEYRVEYLDYDWTLNEKGGSSS